MEYDARANREPTARQVTQPCLPIHHSYINTGKVGSDVTTHIPSTTWGQLNMGGDGWDWDGGAPGVIDSTSKATAAGKQMIVARLTTCSSSPICSVRAPWRRKRAFNQVLCPGR